MTKMSLRHTRMIDERPWVRPFETFAALDSGRTCSDQGTFPPGFAGSVGRPD